MSRAIVATGALLSAYLFCASVNAEDAYDDEEKVRRPDEREVGPESERETEEALSVGGLEAPEALSEEGDTRTDIERSLDEADEKDAGRGLAFIWVDTELGFSFLNPTALRNDHFLPETVSTSGLSLGAGLGIRALYFTLGARYRQVVLGDFSLLSVAAEVGLKVPYGSLEPYVALSVGYIGISGVDGASAGAPEPSIDAKGVDTRLALGLDYYLSDSFSMGGKLSSDFLFLGRDLDPDLYCGGSASSCPDRGSSTGIGLGASVLFGLHF